MLRIYVRKRKRPLDAITINLDLNFSAIMHLVNVQKTRVLRQGAGVLIVDTYSVGS